MGYYDSSENKTLAEIVCFVLQIMSGPSIFTNTCKAWLRGDWNQIESADFQRLPRQIQLFKMEDDSPVIYGLELNVSNQLIGLPFALQTSFVNNFKGLSFLKKI